MVLFSLLIVFGWSTRINRWICAFLSSFHYNAYCSRTMAAIKHVRLHSSIRARVEPPSVVRQYKHALFSRGSVLTHIAAEKGNWFRTYRWHFRVIDFIAWRPPRVFLSPSWSPNSFFRHSRLLFSFPFQTQHRLFFSSSLFARLLSAAATMNLYRSFQNL